MRSDITQRERAQEDSRVAPGHDSGRDKADCAALLEYLLSLPADLPDRLCPSTAELTDMKRFGLRPPNRCNDLKLGKFDGHRYDIERIPCGRGVYRWRLHEPAPPGYPKNKQHTVLHLAD